MKIFKESSISDSDFSVWSGAVDTRDKILEADKAEEFDRLIEETYPDGIGETELNDLLWFEPEWIFEMLGISDEDEEDDNETEEDDE